MMCAVAKFYAHRCPAVHDACAVTVMVVRSKVVFVGKTTISLLHWDFSQKWIVLYFDDLKNESFVKWICFCLHIQRSKGKLLTWMTMSKNTPQFRMTFSSWGWLSVGTSSVEWMNNWIINKYIYFNTHIFLYIGQFITYLNAENCEILF